MSFDKNSLTRVGGIAPNPALFNYTTTDLKTVVTTSGYFNPAYNVLNVDDLITVVNSEGEFQLRVTSVATNAVIIELALSGFPKYLGASSYGMDAWGRQKVVRDISQYHGMFTFTTPEEYWKETLNGTELTAHNNASSVNGKLNLTSNGVLNDVIGFETFRNPRYQPNRGLLYSASIILPNPTNNGAREFGAFTEEAGIFFRLVGDGSSWALYLIVRTTIGGTPQDTATEITDYLPSGFNPAMRNVYDIQGKWRGAGGFMVFIGDEADEIMKPIIHVKQLNNDDELTIFNPALPLAFSCKNTGADVVIQCGCVDMTSEGGDKDKGFYGSIGIDNTAGQVAISGFNVPVLVVRSKAQFGTLRNTRDIIALLATAYSDQRSILRVWATRDVTAITLNDQTWRSFRDGNIDFIQYDNPDVTTPITFDTAKAQLIFTARLDQDRSYATSALFEGRTDIFQTPSDIFIFTVHRETGTAANVGVTYEFAEEI